MWFAALLLIPVVDQIVKVWLRRTLGSSSVRLGPVLSLQIVTARVWLVRSGGLSSVALIWIVWVAGAGALMIVAAAIPASKLFAGILAAGSLSHALETSWRGTVSDYICSRFWPAFNLADVAISVGAIGVVIQVIR
jgi:lipoprotein signal peptidase